MKIRMLKTDYVTDESGRTTMLLAGNEYDLPTEDAKELVGYKLAYAIEEKDAPRIEDRKPSVGTSSKSHGRKKLSSSKRHR